MRNWVRLGALVTVVAAIGLAGGCEKVTTTVVLVVTPSSAQVERGGIVQLVVSLPEADRDSREIYYPLTWEVSDPAVGTVKPEAGNAAVYTAHNVKGVNTVLVRDRSGAEGMAVITQP